MSGHGLRGLVMVLALGSTTTLASAALPSIDLDVTLDPDSKKVEVVATLHAEAGDTDLRWHLTTTAGLDPAVLVLPASPHRRTRAIRYALPLAPGSTLSHRDTLTDTAATAGPQGSFLPGASAWHPAPADGGAFTYRLKLSLPAGQRGLVPGRLEGESIEGGRYVARFAFDHPAEGIDLMAGPYAVDERVLDAPAGVRLRTYFHPELQSLAHDYLDAAAAYLARYSREIGDYPYTEFSIVSSPTPTGFGMPTLTYLGIDVLKLPFIRHTSLGHEVLHNWWGNGVRVDYEHGNWCEGLTTFLADYAYKEQEGPQPARQMRLAWLRDLAALPPDANATLRGFVSRTHGASQIVGYHKAALLFLALRDRLGEERFRQALRSFWQQYRFRTASWTDIQRVFEHAAGEPLTRLFDETLDRTRMPSPQITQAVQQPDGRLAVTLRQSDPPAQLRVPLRVRGDFGERDYSVEFADGEAQFTLTTPGGARQVLLDPDLRLMRQLSPAELPPILRQVMVAPRVALQIPDGDAALLAAGRALAGALLDSDPVADDAPARLLVGTHGPVDNALRRLGLQRPDGLTGKGSAQAWATLTAEGEPLMVVSVRDVAALQALARPLPHYGGQGWLVFEGAKAIERGQWPTQSPAVDVR